MKYWVLCGHWFGMPCAIQRGGHIPTFSVWSVVDQDQFTELRAAGFYSRRKKSRPTDYVDCDFQRSVPENMFEDRQ